MSTSDFDFEAFGNRPVDEDRPARMGDVPAFDAMIFALRRTDPYLNIMSDPEWVDCIQQRAHSEMRLSNPTDELHRMAREQLLAKDGYERLAKFNKQQSRNTMIRAFSALALVASVVSATFIVQDTQTSQSDSCDVN